MYSTLMVHLDLDKDNANLLDITGDLAERFDADVVGIVACQPVSVLVGDGFISTDVVEQERAQLTVQIEAAEKAFRAALEHRSRHLKWRSMLTYGPPTDYIVKQMRSADLLVTGVEYRGSWLDPSWHVDTADLIMQAGRPVLVVPERTRQLLARNILVGWKDSRETRRAVSDALPFLMAAERVVVVEVVADEAGIPDARANANDVCAWLERHDVLAQPLASATGDEYVVPLDEIARKEGADLIVAGAYGHSRLHEWVLGGVTRDLLLDSSRCFLLAH
ncbi:MAG: universal stress protein [Rhodanobacteraceae bacterium]